MRFISSLQVNLSRGLISASAEIRARNPREKEMYAISSFARPTGRNFARFGVKSWRQQQGDGAAPNGIGNAWTQCRNRLRTIRRI
jgi:hypothetical protein